ncbi:hypothetical protein AXX17_ATUG04520 [Arabidopsis thaliana]|uniref:nicotinate phosphoribosyltransferase n=1 Tax=Arabidopsis thaliana TaxID=3702 RepID=A0A178U7D2_ARATH|nr:hypothetical protein AXX17_ATUG04520 [Arabidopsis thaliana]
MKEHMNMENTLKVREELWQNVSDLSDEQLNTVVVPGKWTIMQVLDHLYLMERAITKGLSAAIASGEDHPTELKPFLLTLDRTRRIDAPAPLVPSAVRQSLSSVHAKLDQSRAALLQAVEGISDEVLERRSYPHPVFGLMDVKQWLSFVGVHEQRHMEQIKELREIGGALLTREHIDMRQSKRFAMWAGFVLIVLYLIKLQLTASGYIPSRIRGSEWFLGLAGLYATATLLISYRHSDRARYWLYYACGTFCYAIAEFVWLGLLHFNLAHRGQFSAAHVLWMLQFVLYLAALFNQYKQNKRKLTLRFMTEILFFGVIAFAQYWFTSLLPLIQGGHTFSMGLAGFFLFCSSMNIVLLSGLVILCLYERNSMPRSAIALLIAGFFIRSMGNTVIMLLGDRSFISQWYGLTDLTWFVGLMLIGFAGVAGIPKEETLLTHYRLRKCTLFDHRLSISREFVPLLLGALLLMIEFYTMLPAFLASLLFAAVGLLLIRLFLAIYEGQSANLKLRDSNANYRTWAENSLVGLFVVRSSVIVYANRHLECIFGYEPGGMIGHPVEEWLEAEDIKKYTDQLEKQLGSGGSPRFDIIARRLDRSVLYLEVQLTTTIYEGEAAQSGVVLDITERKLSEQWLIRSEKLSVIGQLAAGVAHEIRNPLTALKGFTQLLQQGADSNRKYFEIMLAELERINYIVGEFMVLSKPHNRQQLQAHDIHHILTGIIPILDSQAIMHNVSIEIRPPREEHLVHCDENQIKQVLINLLKNAIEAMTSGGYVRVRYDYDELKREMTMHIEDEGPGIPQEMLARLGEPFFTTKDKGTGLGLMVCFKIIQAHGGTLEVANRERRSHLEDNELTLHTDKYQINMMYAHWVHGTLHDKEVFELYFRKLPFGNGYAVCAGLERVVHYLNQLHFGEAELHYLREQEEQYDEGFLTELRSLRFTGNLHAVAEGTLVFPNEPLIRVEARTFEAHLIETALLNFVNYQTLIATKASRIKQVAHDDILLEFGTRRAQEADAAIWGARASYLAGFHATSNLRAGMRFGIPTKGTHAHAWIQGHDSEEEAFRLFAEALPDQASLLVDTYDTLKSGVPHAIQTAKWLEGRGKRLQSIRIDSGDLAYTSKQARAMLDAAGFTDVKIIASNDLDENLILNLKAQNAKIDIWGIGTQLITAADQPSLGGVYKLVARETKEGYEPVIKISGNPEKVSNPGVKALYRIIDEATDKAVADYMPLWDEDDVEQQRPLRLFDPAHPYRNRTVNHYRAIPLLQPIFQNGEFVYELPSLSAIRAYHEEQLGWFWPEFLRKLNPELYRVNLSQAAWDLKMELIHRYQAPN